MSVRRVGFASLVSLTLVAVGGSAQQPILQNFSFGKGRPAFSGLAPTKCGTVRIVALNSEPFGQGFRNVPNGDRAEVSFVFEKPVRQFDLGLSFVRSDEYVTEFNAKPTSVSGTLTQTSDRVTTSRPSLADDGAGAMTWMNPPAEVSFVIGGPPGTALAVDGYAVSCLP